MKKSIGFILAISTLMLFAGCSKSAQNKNDTAISEPISDMVTDNYQPKAAEIQTYIISDMNQSEFIKLINESTVPVYIQYEFNNVNYVAFCNEESCADADAAYEWVENRLDPNRLLDSPNGELLLPPVISSGNSGDFAYLLHSNGKMQLISHHSGSTNLVIPDEINGYPVSYIGNAFCGFDGTQIETDGTITDIVLGKNIEYIDKFAFYGLDALENVQLNDGLIYIGYDAFACDERLTEIELPNSVAKIGTEAFSGSGLRKIQLNDHSDVGEYAFFESALTAVNFPKEQIKIEDSAFAFTDLQELEIPANILFKSDTEQCGIFRGNEKLKKVSFAPQMDEPIIIPAEMFSENRALQQITFPNNVTKIGEMSFFMCTSLKDVHIPASVTQISESAFQACYTLKDVYFESADCDMTGCGLADHYVRIHAPSGGSVEQYCRKNILNRFIAL